jgi:hypothetical protein
MFSHLSNDVVRSIASFVGDVQPRLVSRHWAILFADEFGDVVCRGHRIREAVRRGHFAPAPGVRLISDHERDMAFAQSVKRRTTLSDEQPMFVAEHRPHCRWPAAHLLCSLEVNTQGGYYSAESVGIIRQTLDNPLSSAWRLRLLAGSQRHPDYTTDAYLQLAASLVRRAPRVRTVEVDLSGAPWRPPFLAPLVDSLCTSTVRSVRLSLQGAAPGLAWDVLAPDLVRLCTGAPMLQALALDVSWLAGRPSVGAMVSRLTRVALHLTGVDTSNLDLGRMPSLRGLTVVLTNGSDTGPGRGDDIPAPIATWLCSLVEQLSGGLHLCLPIGPHALELLHDVWTRLPAGAPLSLGAYWAGTAVPATFRALLGKRHLRRLRVHPLRGVWTPSYEELFPLPLFRVDNLELMWPEAHQGSALTPGSVVAESVRLVCKRAYPFLLLDMHETLTASLARPLPTALRISLRGAADKRVITFLGRVWDHAPWNVSLHAPEVGTQRLADALRAVAPGNLRWHLSGWRDLTLTLGAAPEVAKLRLRGYVERKRQEYARNWKVRLLVDAGLS